MGLLQRVLNRITTRFSNSTSGSILERIETESQRDICISHIHSSTIHHGQNVEATHVSIRGCMGKQNVVYMYDGILFSLKKKDILTPATAPMRT